MTANQSPNESDAFFSLFSGGVNAQIHELVQELSSLMRDESVDAIVKSYDYLHQWFAGHIDLDGVDNADAFYYGFYLGTACIRELYTSSDRTQSKEEGEE